MTIANALNLNSSNPLPMNEGGSGNNMTAANGAIAYSDATKINLLSPTAIANQLLISGSSSAPAWSTSTYPATNAINTLLYASGANTMAALSTANGSTLITDGSGVPSWQALGAGQVFIGNNSSGPVAAAINSGTGILVANSAANITVNAIGGGISWTTTGGTTQVIAINNGYVSGNAAQSTFTLPALAALGAVAAVEGLGVGGWILTANSGQTIQLGTAVTSSGGTLTSAAATDNVYVRCIVANTTWRVISTNSTGLTPA